MMAYWIHENGETIGPLRREQVLQQAGPGTPVSDGGEWINLGQHPDFAGPLKQSSVPEQAPQPEPERATAPEVQAPAPAETAEAGADREKAPDPEDSDFRRVRRLAKASKPPVAEKSRRKETSLGRWVIVVAGFAITGLVVYALLQSGVGKWPWFDSRAVDIIDINPDDRIDELPEAPMAEHGIEASDAVEAAVAQPEAGAAQTAAEPGTIDGEVAATHDRLRETAKALHAVEAELEKFSFRHPTFEVSGEIKDRGEGSVQLWGVALPSTGDITHVGAQVQKGNIVVEGVTRLDSQAVFDRQGLYFVEQRTGENTPGGSVPIRIYSTQAPPDRVAVEQEFDRLRNEMRPYQLEIERLKGELATLHEEKDRQEWAAIIGSVPELVIYAKEHFELDDPEASARACSRIEVLAPAEAEPFIECGLLAERVGDDDLALARYREALSREPQHPVANRREALLASRQQEDPFEEARHLLRYEEYDDPTATDAQAVHVRLAELKDEWGREARRACLAFDTARIDQTQWEAMKKGLTSREAVARNIGSCERAKSEARAALQTLNKKLASIGLSVQSLMMNSRADLEYWQSRRGQASALRQQIGSAEESLKYEYQQDQISIHRERIRQYREILSEIEQEARKVGVEL